MGNTIPPTANYLRFFNYESNKRVQTPLNKVQLQKKEKKLLPLRSKNVSNKISNARVTKTNKGRLRHKRAKNSQKTPLLDPNIDDNVSDIEEPEDINEGENKQSLNQYLSQSREETSPTATDNSSYEQSFGMDSSDSVASPQRKVEIDMTYMEKNFHGQTLRDNDAVPDKQLMIEPSSPSFSSKESSSNSLKPPNGDGDEFSHAASEDEEIYHGSVGFNCDASSIAGTESLLSQGTSTEFDNMSKGDLSKGESISDMSFSAIPSFIIKNKQQQRMKYGNTNSFKDHTTSLNLSIKSSQTTSKSIHSRRKLSLSRSRSEGRASSKRPNASNAFETLPRHLIKTGMIRQAVTTLKDERFVKRRIEKLGAIYAAKIHVSDFELLQKRDKRYRDKKERERDAKDGGLEAELPTSQMFPDGDDFFSVMIDSFELFLKCVLEICGVIKKEDLMEIDKGCEVIFEEGDEENCEEEEEVVVVQQEKKLEPKISPNEGGKAIMNLGNFLQKKDWHDDAMYFFRHALYIFLFEVDVIKPMLLNEEEYCDGLFYDEISADGLKVISQTHELLGAILIKMGDVHGKNLEVNDALRAYRAAQVFWNVYLRNHKVSNQEGNEEDDEDLNELTDYAASIEGLALSHNRIGGVYTSKGDLQAALNSFHEALSLQIDALGDDHLEVAKTLHNIGVCHRHNDEWDEALEYYKKAHFIFETNVGKCHLDTARTMHNIGGVYRRKKMYPEAMKCFVEVLRVRRKILGDDHPSVSIALVSIAAVLRRSGRKEEANKFYAAAVR